jgi:hypothetical protein
MTNLESQPALIKLSYVKYVLVLAFLVGFEYMAIKIVSMPYSELELNADRFHPLMAYLFFIPLIPLIAVVILSLLFFLFSRNKGVGFGLEGIFEKTSPFSIGFIPYEKISSISNITSLSVGRWPFKSQRDAISINLRNRKQDENWWSSKGWRGRLLRGRSYEIQTSLLALPHNNVVEILSCHAKKRGIKIYTINLDS